MERQGENPSFRCRTSKLALLLAFIGVYSEICTDEDSQSWQPRLKAGLTKPKSIFLFMYIFAKLTHIYSWIFGKTPKGFLKKKETLGFAFSCFILEEFRQNTVTYPKL